MSWLTALYKFDIVYNNNNARVINGKKQQKKTKCCQWAIRVEDRLLADKLLVCWWVSSTCLQNENSWRWQ